MLLVPMSFEFYDNDNKQNFDKTESLKHIEKCGRCCYKSEESIKEDSYLKFYENTVTKKKHESITEHCVFTKILDKNIMSQIHNIMLMDTKFYLLKHFKISIFDDNSKYYVTANSRAWNEFYKNVSTNIRNNIFNIPNFNIEEIKTCFPKIYNKHRFVTIKFTLDLGISVEFLRHRINQVLEENIDLNFSYSQESSRYIKYSADGKGKGCKFIDIDKYKSFFKLKNVTDYKKGLDILYNHLYNVEQIYNDLSSLGFPSEWSRAVLPKISKTELIMSAYCEDWKKFFDLRTENGAHPMARFISIDLLNEFKSRGFYESIES